MMYTKTIPVRFYCSVLIVHSHCIPTCTHNSLTSMPCNANYHKSTKNRKWLILQESKKVSQFFALHKKKEYEILLELELEIRWVHFCSLCIANYISLQLGQGIWGQGDWGQGIWGQGDWEKGGWRKGDWGHFKPKTLIVTR